MLDRTKASLFRSFLAALLPLGLVLVVCDVQPGSSCDPTIEDCTPPGAQPGAQPYELNVGCAQHAEPIDVRVRAGSEAQNLFACPADDVAIDPVTGSLAGFEMEVAGTTEVDCSYETGDGVPTPFDCTGTLELAANWDSSGFAARTEPNTLHVGLLAVALGAPPPGTFDVSATIDCPGVATMDLPTDGTTIDFPDLLPAGSDNQGSCDILVTFDSSVVAAGESLHTISVFAEANPRACTSSAQCPMGMRCGPSGCQTGDAGQSCAAPFVPVDADLDLPPLGDCNATAPICTTFARCSAGNANDGCRAAADCRAGLVCSGLLFGVCVPAS